MPKEIKTKVLDNPFNGRPMFSVFKVDDEGKKKKDDEGQFLKPVVNMGIKKAEYCIRHIEELKKYVEENKE